MSAKAKKLITVFVALTLFTSCVSGCTRSREPEKITVIEKQSIYRGFIITGAYVRIFCCYAVKNNTSEPLKFKIKGNFKADVRGGLLKEETLYAASMAMGIHGEAEYIFAIGPEKERKIEVVFIGESGGSETRLDERLPKIEIEYINESE